VKILDRYILTAYLKTFISVFVILMLIFVLQAVWLYITELAGKDLDIAVVVKFLMYITPTLIPLILPLTILLTSIMVFGNFAENYEFAAMKSTGISLQRAMRSLSVFIVILGIATFFISNNVIPWAQYNSYNLRKNIAKLKPAMAIAEGQFNDIGNINIKVAEKSGDRGQYLKDVVIHKKPSSGIGNYTTILSKTGELVSSEESNILKLVLFDGWYYDDIQKKDYKERQKKPFAKSEFKKYTINVDLSEINNIDLDEKQITSKYDMLGIKELDYTIDSLVQKKSDTYQEFSSNIYNRSAIQNLNKGLKIENDSIYRNEIADLFELNKKSSLVDLAINSVRSTKDVISSKDAQISRENKWLNKHVYAYHEKFTLGFACIILFFVGAPLGALIKKGGLGLPMVIAIFLFLTYHFIGLFAKNSGYNGKLDPVLSAWLPTMIMFPLSIYLTRTATFDKPIISFSFISEPIKKLFKADEESEEEINKLLDENSTEFAILQNHDTTKLIDIIKNYHQYDYPRSYRNSSIKILNSRGVSEEELRMGGNLSNQVYEDASRAMSLHSENSKITLTAYLCFLTFTILALVFNNNKLPTLAIVSTVLTIIFVISFLVYLIRQYTNLSNFYQILDQKNSTNNFGIVVLGIPLYFLIYFYYQKKLKEDIKQIN
jgi:lipopolysaccharide export system permease protein